MRCPPLGDWEGLFGRPAGLPPRNDAELMQRAAALMREGGRQPRREEREGCGHGKGASGRRLSRPNSIVRPTTFRGSTATHSSEKAAVRIRINDPDPEGHRLVHFFASSAGMTSSNSDKKEDGFHYISSMESYVRNVPSPGVGRFALSDVVTTERSDNDGADLVDGEVRLHRALEPVEDENAAGTDGAPEDNLDAARVAEAARADLAANNGGNGGNQEPMPPAPPQGNNPVGWPAFGHGNVAGGPRVLNLIWLISAQMGWSVDDSRTPGSIMVDRRIVIATQWLGNSFCAVPLILNLLLRFGMWVTPSPLDYHLDGLPFVVEKQMRYLTSAECGYAALVIMILYLVLGRYTERHVGRSYERAMMEGISSLPSPSRHCQSSSSSTISPDRPRGEGPLTKSWSKFKLWIQRKWDVVCPLFLQRKVFTPQWNRASRSELTDHILRVRSEDFREHKSSVHADSTLGKLTHGCFNETGNVIHSTISFSKKLLIGLVVGIGSFVTCSPHFVLNLLTVFFCSIATGISMSLQSTEAGGGPHGSGLRSRFKPLGLNTLVITFVLMGQLVGSSGGILFLAEFVVTFISLMLGGAATISTNAVESWVCFFCLSTTAFWGYLFARVGLLDGMRTKRCGGSSFVLCASILFMAVVWVTVVFFFEWEIPSASVILRSGGGSSMTLLFQKGRRDAVDKKEIARQLQ